MSSSSTRRVPLLFPPLLSSSSLLLLVLRIYLWFRVILATTTMPTAAGSRTATSVACSSSRMSCTLSSCSCSASSSAMTRVSLVVVVSPTRPSLKWLSLFEEAESKEKRWWRWRRELVSPALPCLSLSSSLLAIVVFMCILLFSSKVAR